MPSVSNKLEVRCDICQEPMSHKQGAPSMEYYACYPCDNLIYESQLWQYDSQVTVVKAEANEQC
jgi:hypothetical protein